MTTIAALIILAVSAFTAFLSGVFGMAGGIILMGALIALPSVTVPMAMIIHGALQMTANAWRSWLLRDDVDWTAFWRYCMGAAAGTAALFLVTWQPNKQHVYFLLGLAPLLIWLPKERLHLDIQRRGHAIGAGFSVQALNTLAGVAGPLLDLFFVRNAMTRQEIVATKSITQAVSHAIKIGFWSVPLVSASGWGAFPPPWFFAAAIPIAMTSTWLGGLVLKRMDDTGFKRIVKWLVTAIGAVMMARAFGLY